MPTTTKTTTTAERHARPEKPARQSSRAARPDPFNGITDPARFLHGPAATYAADIIEQVGILGGLDPANDGFDPLTDRFCYHHAKRGAIDAALSRIETRLGDCDEDLVVVNKHLDDLAVDAFQAGYLVGLAVGGRICHVLREG